MSYDEAHRREHASPLPESSTGVADDAILLIDDRREPPLDLAAMLAPLAVTVVTATSGLEAVRQLRRRDFAVLVLAADLSRKQGSAMTEALRSHPRAVLIPIIVIGARDQGERERLRGYEAGASDVVTAPLEASILRAKVAALLDLQRRQAERLARVNAEQSQRIAALEELQRCKDLLTGMVIHDLRNPLAACLGSLALAGSQADKDRTRSSKYLAVAQECTQHVLTLVDGIVDLMRMEDGDLPVSLAEVDLDALIDGRVERYGGAALAKGIRLARGATAPAGRCTTDGELIGRVIDNLVVNAIKHTRSGGTVTISGQRTGPGRVTIAIGDTGEGIPAAAIAGLFQKYGRVQGQALGSRQDAGLGLVFCRMAVELLGGTIAVASARDRGTTFTVDLPGR